MLWYFVRNQGYHESGQADDITLKEKLIEIVQFYGILMIS